MGAPQSANTGRIAKNTIFLAARQLIVMCVALFTSRVILEALGVVDFGVYNVVAGVSASFVFFSTTLATSTQRFLSYEMGRGNSARVRRMFSVSFWAMVSIGLIVIVVGGALGPWIVYHVLNIPADRMFDALIVFYAMIVAMAILMVFSTFEAVLIARENMKIYAYLGILDAVVKLAIAYIIMVVPDKLITYGFMMVGALLLPKLIMLRYCRRHYPESLPEKIWDKQQLKVFLRFAGWNLYEGLVWVINTEGINVVLNIYFGPVVNAARGVTQQVNGAITNFCVSFFTAVRPQIVKSYAGEAYDEVRKLVSIGSRGSYYIIWLLALPIMLRAPQILSLWLVEVPDYTIVFLRWTMAFLLVNSLNPPVATLSQATGDMRRFMLYGMNAYLASFPVAIVAVILGAPAWAVYPILITGRFASVIIGLYTLRQFMHISLTRYVTGVLVPIMAVTVLSLSAVWLLDEVMAVNIPGLIVFGATSVLTTVAVIFFAGLSRSERHTVLAKLKARLHHKSA